MIKVNIREKCVRGRKILQNLSFELNEREITGLVGENGAGKSSVMKIISGLTADFEGEIYFHNTLPETECRFAAFIEDPKLLSGCSGLQNLQRYEPFISEAGRERQNRLLRAWNLEKDLKKKTAAYSFGMKQKLGLIILFGFEGRYYLVDEPTNGLDDAARSVLFKEIQDMRQAGSGFLISSHNLNEISELCDRVIKMRDGSLENADYQFQKFLTLKGNGLNEELVQQYFTVKSCQNGYAEILYEDTTIERLAELKRKVPSLEMQGIRHFYQGEGKDEADS